eukprot:CAMPEP_0194579536 /NCGR_PEP_ID=MMETSP0292-20121207/13573_1 /TAXON_ID=39354 /ORGANISM="Heterosigma akashiwo, Strain CCMP2393" /LENGTH=193 /DNA_ID=CAMNT_0039432527 /DNA_START=79 /DNA_END=660 /DNA_ORIENTATION=-
MATKDLPQKPKAARSSFSYFFEDVKAEINAELPGLSFKEQTAKATEKWYLLDEVRKAEYITRADEDRERYCDEMEDYVEPATKKARRDAEKDDLQPKKAATAYILFTNHIRPEVTKDNPDQPMTILSKVIADRWNMLSDADKQLWTDKAEADKDRYTAELQEYNDYRSMLALPPLRQPTAAADDGVSESKDAA